MSGVTVSLLSGNDTFPGGAFTNNAGNDSVLGNTGHDSIVGGTGNDSLAGGAGDDTLTSGAGTRQILMGDQGSDSLVGSSENETMLGGDGDDTLVGGGSSAGPPVFVGYESIFGGAGADSISGQGEQVQFDGGADNDTLSGGGYEAVLSGGDGDDRVQANADDLTFLIGGNGNDTLLAGGGYGQNLKGDEGADSLVGSAGNEENQQGGNGHDTLVAGSGGDQRLYGDDPLDPTATGNDSLVGGNTSGDWLFGGGGDDTLAAGGGLLQRLDGGNGNDSLLGNSAAESLDGSDGDDTLRGLAGNDTLIGGAGNDWASYEGAATAITVNLGTGASTGAHGNDSLTGIENILGGDGDDSLVGNGNANILDGGAGNDTLVGGDSATDWASYEGAAAAVTVNLQSGVSSGARGADSLIGVENVLGGAGNDSIVGDSSINVLDGGAGDDTLRAEDGSNTLHGGEGNDFASYAQMADGVSVSLYEGIEEYGTGDHIGGVDRLYNVEGVVGSDYDDTLIGGDAANTLLGGAGNDWMDFGLGDEAYQRSASETGNDTLIGGDGTDTLDLGSNWSFMTLDGAYSLYQDQADTIYAQGWEQVVCFAEGTRIVTPNGEDAVENLRAGDMVLAMRDGQAGFEPLRWVGFMDIVVPRNAAMAAKTAPVLIKAGALAHGMPARDLRVSPDHAMEVDGHLIPAKHLVNGESIIQEVWCRRVRYFHLELEAHGLLLSEGTWSESYLDDGNRHAFNNAALTGLFLDFEAGRSKGQYDHQACLPVLRQGLKLDAIHGRIALRAAALLRPEKRRRKA